MSMVRQEKGAKLTSRSSAAQVLRDGLPPVPALQLETQCHWGGTASSSLAEGQRTFKYKLREFQLNYYKGGLSV